LLCAGIKCLKVELALRTAQTVIYRNGPPVPDSLGTELFSSAKMDTSLEFADVGMDFDALDVLPTYNLHRRPSTDRLRRLREILGHRGLEAYLIVDSDAHYTFYSQARHDRRINYITNSDVPSPWPRP